MRLAIMILMMALGASGLAAHAQAVTGQPRCVTIEIAPRVRQIICPRTSPTAAPVAPETTAAAEIPAAPTPKPKPVVRRPAPALARAPEPGTVRVIRRGLESTVSLMREPGSVLLVRGGRERIVAVK